NRTALLGRHLPQRGTIPGRSDFTRILPQPLHNWRLVCLRRASAEKTPMVFGKKSSNSPSAPSHAGGDDTYRQQPPHIRRLIDAMQTIFDDTSKLANAITQGGSLPSSTPAEPHRNATRCPLCVR